MVTSQKKSFRGKTSIVKPNPVTGQKEAIKLTNLTNKNQPQTVTKSVTQPSATSVPSLQQQYSQAATNYEKAAPGQGKYDALTEKVRLSDLLRKQQKEPTAAPQYVQSQADTKTFQAEPKFKPVTEQQPILDRTPQSTAPTAGFQVDLAKEELLERAYLKDSTLTADERSQAIKYQAAKTVAQRLSPEQQAQNVKDAYSPVTDELKTQIGQEEERIAQERENRRLTDQEKLEQFRSDVGAKYAPQIGEAKELGSQRKENTMRVQGFKGVARSSESQTALDNIEREINNQVSAIEAAKRTEIALYQAQLEGASDEYISMLSENLSNLRQKAQDYALQASQAYAQEYNAAVQAGDAYTQAIIQNLADLATAANSPEQLKDLIDGQIALSEAIGDGYLYKLDENGTPVRVPDANGNPLSVNLAGRDVNYQQVKQTDLLGNERTVGYFDPATGQTAYYDQQTGQPVSQGSSQPFQVVENSKITAYGSSKWAQGLDVAGTPKSPIKTPYGGTVTSVRSGVPDTPPGEGKKYGFGNQVKIKTDDGYELWFSHLDQPGQFQEGQRINAGDVIGTLGRTGYTMGKTGYHLDLTVKKPDGSYMTPQEIENYAKINQTVQPSYSSSNSNVTSYFAEANALGLKGAEAEAYAKQRAAGLSGDQATPAMSEADKLKLVLDLRTSYKPISDEIRKLEEGISAVNNYDINHKNPYQDQSLIFAFMKVLDPASVVREGEFNVAQNNQGLLDSISTKWQQAINANGTLTPEARNKIINEMNRLYASKSSVYQNDISSAKELASAYGVEVSQILSLPQNFGAQKNQNKSANAKYKLSPSLSESQKKAIQEALNSGRLKTQDLIDKGILIPQ